jgi:hypothetical protein
MTSQVSSELESPGFWRRIKLRPLSGLITAGLEDDFHRFLIRLTHANDRIISLDARADRIPYSTCPDAGPFLAEQAVGQRLQVVASFDPHIHCTHLFELLVLCAAHALDAMPTQFDLRVADRKDNRTSATLSENGNVVLRWEMNGTLIEGPDDWAGRELRQFSTWKKSLSASLAERAMLLRRAVHVSNGRKLTNQAVKRPVDRGPARLGACFTYQMPRVLNALQSSSVARDFSRSGTEPLQDFDP